jgi:hypothetical protein
MLAANGEWLPNIGIQETSLKHWSVENNKIKLRIRRSLLRK